MGKKLFVIKERIIPSAQAPSVSRNEIASSSRHNPVTEHLHFFILDETVKSFPNFNATGISFLIKFNFLGEEPNSGTYLTESISALTDYLLDDVSGRDLVGLIIRNTENVKEKVFGIGLRRRDQPKSEMV